MADIKRREVAENERAAITRLNDAINRSLELRAARGEDM